jgi:gliding motility-associated-like protein
LTWPNPPIVELNCEDPSYLAKIETAEAWNIQWANGDTTTQSKLTDTQNFVTLKNKYGCEKRYEISLNELPNLDQIPQFNDKEINAGDVANLSVDIDTSIWKLKWSPSEIISCDSCKNVSISVSENVAITLALYHILSECTYSKSFKIIKNNKTNTVLIPNIIAISSIENNFWEVIFPENYKVKSINIYDRWGNKVFNSKEITIKWDGTFNGQFVAEGVYIYTIEYYDDNEKLVLMKGDLTVLR